MSQKFITEVCIGISMDSLPEPKKRSSDVPHAPVRNLPLSLPQTKIALVNALRYFPQRLHHILAPEFAEELKEYGHIYMYRFMPSQHLQALPVEEYKAKSLQAAAIMLIICNNLDPRVAEFPEELVTYGADGQIFSNWAQFRLVMHYLSKMTDSQTLIMYSGHPLGLFPAKIGVSPRVVITNGMVIPGYSTSKDYDPMLPMGVSTCGQMTPGSYCYIGPQGIVHATTITIMNAGRKYLHLESLKGTVFVTSGLGVMSGAQAKAAVIAGAIGVIAEINKDTLLKRYHQGWLHEISSDLPDLLRRIRRAQRDKQATSIGHHGNVIDLWEYFAKEAETTGELLVELGSDQTSCHNPFNGGYYPADLTFEEANKMMTKDPNGFKELVKKSLRRHIAAIDSLASHGMCFWDYGNGFLQAASTAEAEVNLDGIRFNYPFYVQDIIGDIFSMGFGPFRWICTSGQADDLQLTDKIACQVLRELLNSDVSDNVKCQYSDNIRWIEKASLSSLVVGSQARILYSDSRGRIKIAQAFNDAVKTQRLKGPVVLSRDHHDVSGAESAFQEPPDIYDGSALTADSAVQNFVGGALRGATWVAFNNGGGARCSQVMNGGFGLLLDGSTEAHEKATSLLSWDVHNDTARRAWSGNSYALETIRDAMEEDPSLEVILPHAAFEQDVTNAIMKYFSA